MTSKEKAKDLVTKYAALSITTLGCGYEKGNPCIITNVMFKESAKECALIACNEVLGYMGADRGYEFWTEVKKEIEQL